MLMTRIACFDYQHLWENHFRREMARKIFHRKKNLSTMKVVSISERQFRLTKLLHFVLIYFKYDIKLYDSKLNMVTKMHQ